jgi:geranylgeranyl diphosphate/geranylgeranyl-bacteriochlorophyllide a reductase
MVCIYHGSGCRFMKEYDIVIVGAGPAGSTLARLLDKKFRVLIIDKRPLESDFKNGMPEKSCGGLVSEDAQVAFASLQMALPKSVIVDPQIFTVRTIDLKTGADNYYKKHYVNINREKFDRWLFSLMGSNVKIITQGTYKKYTAAPDGFTVEYFYKGKNQNVKTRFLVSAEGALSNIRRSIDANGDIKRYISIQDYFKNKDVVPYYTALFDNDITDFYSWTIPKDDYIILGSALHEGADAIRKFEQLKDQALKLGLIKGKAFKRTGAPIFRPLRMKDINPGSGNIFMVGEAAGLISPSSAEGFSFALKSAYYLAKAINSSEKDILSRYSNGISSQKSKIARRWFKSPAMFNPLLRNMAIKSGISSIKILD